jgi:signal transduction histidine kinase/AmiR/NasT family two-component response regulator
MPRILVVDDQKIPRMTVAAILREAGHEVETAESGQTGLDLAAKLSPDVIVLDVHMPEMDGFEVVERLKQNPKTAPTPVVFLTADPPTDELIVRGLELGAYDFLSKGCSRAELLARVGVMARIKRGNDELSAIARISDTLIQTLDPSELSERFVRQVKEVFRADGVLLVFTPGGEEVRLRSAAGIDADHPLADPLIESLLETAGAASGFTDVVCDDLKGAGGVLARRSEFQSAIAVRLEHEGRPPTLLAVFTGRAEGFIRGSDAPLLHLLARQASIALDNALLHARTREQARLMEQQADELERAITQRSRFFASMSHELRTPINAVIGFVQLLEMGTYGEMTEPQTTALSRVNRSAQHLLELINDVLDISKIEAGKLEVYAEETDLGHLVHDTATSVQLQAARKNLDLIIDAPSDSIAITDPARVRQIVLNLLSNAVKFTDEGSVRVSLTKTEQGYEIAVSDTGQGIDEADQQRVFEEFEQTHRTSGGGGTGLGLAISRRLAHLLGGEVHLESTPGEGSTFTLELPAHAPAEETALDPDLAVS